jgi:hypothetical protein
MVLRTDGNHRYSWMKTRRKARLRPSLVSPHRLAWVADFGFEEASEPKPLSPLKSRRWRPRGPIASYLRAPRAGRIALQKAVDIVNSVQYSECE